MKKNYLFTTVSLAFLTIFTLKSYGTNCKPADKLNVTATGKKAVTASIAATVKSNVKSKFNSLSVNATQFQTDINAKLATYVSQNSSSGNWVTSTYNAKKNQAFVDLQAEVTQATSDLTTKIDQLGDTISTQLSGAIVGISPKVVVDGQYDYCRGEFDPADPGWKILGKPRVEGWTDIQASGSFSVNVNGTISFDISPLGVGGSFSFPLTIAGSGTMSVTGTVAPNTPSTPTPKGKPDAKSSITNNLKFTGTGSSVVTAGLLGGQASLSLSTSTGLGTVKIDLKAVEP